MYCKMIWCILINVISLISLAKCHWLPFPDLVPLAARGGDRARQPGAGGAGHGDVGQRLRAVGPRALRRARQGDVGAGGRRAQHEVEGGVRQGPQRGEPLLPRLQGIQVGDSKYFPAFIK